MTSLLKYLHLIFDREDQFSLTVLRNVEQIDKLALITVTTAYHSLNITCVVSTPSVTYYGEIYRHRQYSPCKYATFYVLNAQC